MKAKIPAGSWMQVDISTMTGAQRTAYDAYKAQYATMKTARENFEKLLQTSAPAGKRFAVSYNFGQLSVAIVDRETTAAKDNGKPKLALEHPTLRKRA